MGFADNQDLQPRSLAIICIADEIAMDSGAEIGSHSGTAFKTENFSNKEVVLVKRENGFTKTLFSLFFSGLSVQGIVLVNPCLRFSKTTVFFTKSSVLRQGFLNDF